MVFTAIIALSSHTILAQDCDNDGLPDTAELGPFEQAEYGRQFDGLSPSPQRLFGNDTDLFRTSSFLISFWVFRSDATGEGEIWLSTGEPGRPNQSMHIGFRTDHTFTFAFWGDDLNTPGTYPPDGQWHHWACLYIRSSNRREIYRDNVLVASDNSQSSSNATGNLTVGGWITQESSSNGIIDELIVYTNSNPLLIQQLSMGLTPPPGWHLYYKFNEALDIDSAISEPGVGTAPVLNSVFPSLPEAYEYAQDCNSNGIPDECDIEFGPYTDCNKDGIPDECDPPPPPFTADCDSNGISNLGEFGVGELHPVSLQKGRRFNASAVIPQRLTTPSTLPVLFSPTQSYAISMWIYREQTTGNDQIWISTGSDQFVGEINLNIGFLSDDRLFASFRIDNPNNQIVSTAQYPPDGRWHNIILYASQFGQTHLYYDAALIGSMPGSPAITNKHLIIGGLETGEKSANGVIDALGIFEIPSNYPGVPAESICQTQTSVYPYPFGSQAFDSALFDFEEYSPDEIINSGFDFSFIPTGSPEVYWFSFDCNDNGIPDDCDIANGTSQDLNLNGFLDECETDCDSDSIPNAAELGPFAHGDGGGLRFDGTDNSRVFSAADTDFTLSGQSFTVECWVYRDTRTKDDEYILSTGTLASNNELIIGFRENGQFAFSFRGNDLDTTLSYPPDDGQWHHWACTYDTTSNTRTIYRDGVEAASETGIADDFMGHGPLIVGGLSDSLGINGIVDELRIFDHARSQPEIVADMNTQYIDGPIPPTLHAYYPFGPHAGTDFAGTNDLQLVDPGDADYIAYSSDTNNDGVPDECQCPADLTSDGLLNFFDVSAFLAAFSSQDPIADFSPDGLFNFFDVSAFLQAFAAGCP